MKKILLIVAICLTGILFCTALYFLYIRADKVFAYLFVSGLGTYIAALRIDRVGNTSPYASTFAKKYL